MRDVEEDDETRSKEVQEWIEELEGQFNEDIPLLSDFVEEESE